ncbi:hypothetical protein Misp01_56490 [Microtetraspora sp. NBRC 13810]|uniref:hypothetical protein n=1 Tax=Microtetraspora sp. NBRC 13810 TaxID=3030990 RepID=UPI0024A138F2|nr:hypothetical protein [Microtetraspora sp. NBRC 13810]GLW10521.1 hypothetical protein Misp01_56490 [Microtetraspora sp. NBRC 13810]
MTPQSDEDEVWRQIVASYNAPAEHTSADQPWPDSENLPSAPTRRVLRRPDGDGQGPLSDFADDPPADEPARDDDEGKPAGAEGEDEGHYEPPPPPPLPKADPSTKIAWAALFGGPAYLLLAAMFGWQLHGWALFAAVAAFIGGFVALVVRMGDGGPPNDSGWDDGAVL